MATSHDSQFSWPSAIGGIVVGALLCCSNMYFGLQSGWVTLGSMQSALLGFLGFRTVSRLVRFSHTDNVLLQTVAVAAGTLPLAAGFVGVVPALAALASNPTYNTTTAVLEFNWWQLILWALALAFFGVFVAIPLRRQAILREKLPFPSGTATAKLIALFHRLDSLPGDDTATSNASSLARPSEIERHDIDGPSLEDDSDDSIDGRQKAARFGDDDGIRRRSKQFDNDVEDGDDDDEDIIINSNNNNNNEHFRSPLISSQQLTPQQDGDEVVDVLSFNEQLRTLVESEAEESLWRKRWQVLGGTFGLGAFYGFITAFIPLLGNLPVLSLIGLHTASEWGWTLTLSPSYIGQGMIMGLRTAGSMLLGSLLGYAIIGPAAQFNGWVESPLSGPNSGSAWLMWIALAFMFSESICMLMVVAGRWIFEEVQRRRRLHRLQQQRQSSSGWFETSEHDHDDEHEAAAAAANEKADIDPAPVHQRIPLSATIGGLVASTVLGVAILTPMMSMPWYEPLIAIAFSALAAVLAVRSLGTTDMNPVSAISKLSQLLFAAIAPHNPVSNLVAGAISEAAGMQAGELCQDFKTGHLLGASPLAQFYGQLLGATASVFFSVGSYLLYSNAWTIGGEQLPAPSKDIWLNMALVSSGDGIDAPHVIPFCIAAACLVLVLVLGSSFSPKFAKHCPSPVGIGIGFMLSPRFVIPRFAGAIIQLVWQQEDPVSEANYMLLTASGLVLGEGVISILTALLISLGVPVWK